MWIKNRLSLLILLIIVLVFSAFAIGQEEGLVDTFVDVVLEKTSFTRGDSVNIQARLNDEYNSPFTEKYVDFYLDENKIGSGITDNSGIAEMDWDSSSTEPDVYLVRAEFAGDTTLENSSDYQMITIDEAEINKLKPLPEEVQKIDECVDVVYEEEEEIRGTCSYDVVCDEENLSCVSETVEYDCIKEVKKVQKIKQKCKEKAVVIDSIRLDLKEYKCSYNKQGKKVIAICDSIYDGNGDGICQSGESCMKFEIENKEIKQYEKNSKHYFTEEDDTFFVEKMKVEVLK